MNRPLSILTKLTIALAIGECISAVVITVEDYAGSVPGFAVLFGALYVTGAWLLHKQRIVSGASLVGLLSLFEVVTFPSWQKHGTFDWGFDVAYVVLSAVTLAFAVGVLVTQRRTRPARA